MPPVDDKKQPIVLKKIKKGGHEHHGGSWKVAYADFVTAMMAFFLLMWILGSTTEGQKAGISEFFKKPTGVQGPGGASTSMIEFGGALDIPRSEEQDPFKKEEAPPQDLKEAAADKARLDRLMEELKELIESSPSLREFKDQLLIDIVSEGLRIQIVDKENRPMFDLGGTQLKWYTRQILHELAKTIDHVPNHVSIIGHTDARPYSWERRDYSNWELSADRANAARRELIAGGLTGEKVGRVVGLSDSVLFDKEDPYNPVNRRISIIVLNRATERAIGLEPAVETERPDEPAAGAPIEVDTPAPPEPGSGEAVTGADTGAPESPTGDPPLPAPEAIPATEEMAAETETTPAPPEAPAADDTLEGALTRVLGPPPQ